MARNNRSKDTDGFSAIVVLLRIISIAFLISIGVVGENYDMVDYDKTKFLVFAFCAILSSSLWWALSIIVDACQKYNRSK